MYREMKVSKWVLLVDLVFTATALTFAFILNQPLLFAVGVFSTLLLMVLMYLYYENMKSDKGRALSELLADVLDVLIIFR